MNSNIDILDHWCTCPLFPVVNLANHRDGVSGTSNREAQMGVRGGGGITKSMPCEHTQARIS